MTQSPSSQIIDAIGQEFFTDQLGITDRNLRHYRTSGKFAAGWYRDIHIECVLRGVACPLDAFNWKSPDKKLGDDVDDIQGCNGQAEQARACS